MKTVSISAKNITSDDLLKIPSNIASAKYRGLFRHPLAIIHHEKNVYIPVVDNHKVTTLKFAWGDKISVKRKKIVVKKEKNKQVNDQQIKLVQQKLFGTQEELDSILGY
jgi:hypothetical protein